MSTRLGCVSFQFFGGDLVEIEGAPKGPTERECVSDSLWGAALECPPHAFRPKQKITDPVRHKEDEE